MQRRVNEDVIDYDLLEDLVCHIDETYPDGAILVFLPVSSFGLIFQLVSEIILKCLLIHVQKIVNA